jgi:hypothetical protein
MFVTAVALISLDLLIRFVKQGALLIILMMAGITSFYGFLTTMESSFSVKKVCCPCLPVLILIGTYSIFVALFDST